jgi:hypothetical protein
MSSIGTPTGKQRDETVPQLAGCPLRSLQSGCSRNGPEGTPHIGRVELGAVSSGEHQIVVNPLLSHTNPLGDLALSVFAERVDSERRQLQGSAGSLRLRLTTCPHGPPQLNARWRRRQTARITLQIQVTPGECPQFLRTCTCEQ